MTKRAGPSVAPVVGERGISLCMDCYSRLLTCAMVSSSPECRPTNPIVIGIDRGRCVMRDVLSRHLPTRPPGFYGKDRPCCTVAERKTRWHLPGFIRQNTISLCPALILECALICSPAFPILGCFRQNFSLLRQFADLLGEGLLSALDLFSFFIPRFDLLL